MPSNRQPTPPSSSHSSDSSSDAEIRTPSIAISDISTTPYNYNSSDEFKQPTDELFPPFTTKNSINIKNKPFQTDITNDHSTNLLKKPCNPSLITPDFSGLYSVAVLGTTNRNWLNIIYGGIAIFVFIYSWLLGFFLPNLAIIFIIFQWYSTGIYLILFLTFIYVLPLPSSSNICRLYVKYGAYWFHGGTSMCMEFDPTDDKNLIYDKNDPRVIMALKEEYEMSKQLQNDQNDNKINNKSDGIKGKVIKNMKYIQNKENLRPMMITCNPHGIFCLGYFFCGGVRVQACTNRSDTDKLEICGKWALNNNIFNKFARRGLVVGYLSKFPIFNTFITKLTGCVGSVEGKNMKKIMINKESFGICPGGFDEATMFKKNENSVYLKERKGFIKYCLKYGSYEIKPCYIFGECNTYINWTNWLGNDIKYILNRYKIPTVFPMGPIWYFPLLIYMPYRDIGLHCIVGKSIYVPRISDPNQEDIDKYHNIWVKEVERIFDDNKWRFGMNDVKLVVR